MGNRAIIKGKNQALGVYVHWNGGYDSVNAFCTYCKLKGYRSPETDTYGIARLAQVIGNFFAVIFRWELKSLIIIRRLNNSKNYVLIMESMKLKIGKLLTI